MHIGDMYNAQDVKEDLTLTHSGAVPKKDQMIVKSLKGRV